MQCPLPEVSTTVTTYTALSIYRLVPPRSTLACASHRGAGWQECGWRIALVRHPPPPRQLVPFALSLSLPPIRTNHRRHSLVAWSQSRGDHTTCHTRCLLEPHI